MSACETAGLPPYGRLAALIVSGFSVDEKPRVTEALSALFTVTETAEEDDWFAFVLSRVS